MFNCRDISFFFFRRIDGASAGLAKQKRMKSSPQQEQKHPHHETALTDKIGERFEENKRRYFNYHQSTVFGAYPVLRAYKK